MARVVAVGAAPTPTPSKSTHASYGIPGKTGLCTTCGAAVPLLVPKPPVPVKDAVIVWLPTASVEVENAA